MPTAFPHLCSVSWAQRFCLRHLSHRKTELLFGQFKPLPFTVEVRADHDRRSPPPWDLGALSEQPQACRGTAERTFRYVPICRMAIVGAVIGYQSQIVFARMVLTQ